MRNLLGASIIIAALLAGCTFAGSHWTDAAGQKWQAVPLDRFSAVSATLPACVDYKMLDAGALLRAERISFDPL